MMYTSLCGAAQRALAAILLLVTALVTAGFARDDSVRVMTRNMYQGASLDPIILATTFPQLLAAVGQAVQDINNSKPAERAAAMAREIVRYRADLVGLQEVVILRTGSSQLPPNAFVPATAVAIDFMPLLLNELRKRGERYYVVAIVPGIDAQLPTLGFDARLTLSDVIIARKDSDMELSNVQVQGFLVDRSFPSLGGPVPNPRGWASVDVEIDGRKFRFATAHLETPDFPGQPFQAFDMIAGAGNTSLPVLFVGDFNVVATTAADPTYGQFLSAGFKDAWSLKRPGDPGFTCCQDANLLNLVSSLEERIDLVLFRGGFRVEDIRIVGDQPSDRTPSGLWPSDHAGVAATLRIPKH